MIWVAVSREKAVRQGQGMIWDDFGMIRCLMQIRTGVINLNFFAAVRPYVASYMNANRKTYERCCLIVSKGIPSYRHKKVYDGNFKTKSQKLGLGLNLKECTSSFAPASQQRIKRLKPTNTRLKQQFEEFWEPKNYKGGRGAKAPRPPL